MGYLDYAGLQYLWGKLKENFAPKSHSHDDRYYTEAEMDGKLNSKVDNTETGANGLLSKLSVWTATPTDDTYFMRQDTGGGNSFGRVKFSTIWNYIKSKADGTYQPKGSYAASGHTHDDRYYTEAEVDSKLNSKVGFSKVSAALVAQPGNNPYIGNVEGEDIGVGEGSYYSVINLGSYSGGNFRSQIAAPYQDSIADSNMYIRTAAGASWRPWRKIIHSGNIGDQTVAKANVSDSANALSGLSSRSSQSWGIQTGTFIHGEGDTTGGDFAFRRDCPNAGQISMVLDGRFYQNEGQYRVLDESDKNQFATAGHTHSFASITDKPSTYTPSAHNQSWSTITDKPALMESGDYSAETIEALLKQVQGLSPRMGSCCLTKDTHVANTWWNFIYTPHRTGSGGDNPDYGTLLLFPMVGAGSSYIVRAGKNGIVSEIRKIYTSGDKPTKGDVGLGNVDNTADANKSVKYATSAGSANTATKATTATNATMATASNGVKDYNDGNRTIQIGFAGSGLNTSNLNYIAGYTDNGTKIKDVSKDVLTSWIGLGNYLPLSGGTMSDRIVRSGGGSWISDRNNVAVFGNSYGQAAGNSYNPVVGQKTSDGAWTIGNLAGNENLIFNYTTDSDYNAESNNATAVYLPAQAGTIITSATIGSQSVNYANSAGSATSAGSVAWGNVSGKPSTFTPASHTHDDKYYTKTEVNTKLNGKSNTGHTHDDRYYTESEVDLKLANYQPKGNYAAASHTHNYAGSGTAGGSANSAIKLDSSAGSATQPVYFKDGKPVATTYTLNKTVPVDAKFTDTDTWRGIQNNLTSDSTDQSLSAAQGKILKTLVDGKAPTSHTHTKSQITDFPTSMPASDVYAWAKAATKPTYTKAEVGLENVDNTADKDKSVKYAETAGTAEKAVAADNGIAGFYVSSNSTTPSGCIRFNNGIQICWGKTYSGKTSGSFTYPQSFSLPPCVMISGTGAYRYAFYIKNYTNTSFAYYRDGSGDTASPQYVAIGQWEQS